jgi:hypothetical protein
MGFSLLGDFFPFRPFFAQFSPPSYSHRLDIFLNVFNPSSIHPVSRKDEKNMSQENILVYSELFIFTGHAVQNNFPYSYFLKKFCSLFWGTKCALRQATKTERRDTAPEGE